MSSLVALLLAASFGLPSSGETQSLTKREVPERLEADLFLAAEADTGLDFTHFNGMSGELYFNEMMGAGVALLDYDGDGDLDVYLIQGSMLGPGKTLADATFPPRHPAPLTDRLYRNDSWIDDAGGWTLRFRDVTEAAGLQVLGYGMGAATGDFDNDGWVDIYITGFGPNHLLRNLGDGTFEDVTEASGTSESRWSVPATFLDYDDDGWLDLFVGNYVRLRLVDPVRCSTQTGAPEYCGPQGFQDETDRLWRNRGDGTFTDVSSTSGITAAHGAALGAVAADFNRDGLGDLYVANDLSPNQLWINQGDGRFVDDGLLAGCAVNWQGEPEASMGVHADDFDGDGDTDLFMTHLLSQTNTLYLNDGRGVFHDATRESDLGAASWSYTGFGTASIDYDNDGELDLFVANGAVRTIESLVDAGDPFPLHQRNQLFRNLGGGRFEDVSSGVGAWLERSEVSRGTAAGDVDNDGDTDLVVSNNNGPARLSLNRVGHAAAWIGLRLVDASGRDALGATTRTRTVEGVARWRRVRTDSSYASASDPRIVVGLGAATAVQDVTIHWPSGRQLLLERPPLGSYLNVPDLYSRESNLEEPPR